MYKKLKWYGNDYVKYKLTGTDDRELQVEYFGDIAVLLQIETIKLYIYIIIVIK